MELGQKEAEMKLKQFRVEPGHYQIKDWSVLQGGHSVWQVRDQFGDLVEYFRTAREAIRFAIGNTR